MPDLSDEDADSRTAAVGVQRSRSNPQSAVSSRHGSDDSLRPSKKRRRNGREGDREVADFVPRGAAFSANSLAVDPDSTSSSGSSSDSSDDDDGDSDAPAPANPHAGNTAPAISWNQGRKSAVRTTLGKRTAQPGNDKSASADQFNTVNGAYWGTRSASVSSAEKDTEMKDQPQKNGELEDGEIDPDSDSADSVSSDPEADDSIMLNTEPLDSADGATDSLQPLVLGRGHPNGKPSAPALGIESTHAAPRSKEEAFQLLSRKYPTVPTTLMDLDKADLELHAKYLFFDRDIHDIDLNLPITCIECLREGHLAEVCPTKEVGISCPHMRKSNILTSDKCVHCGVWNQHQSTSCPTWRRCQRCRERGHDENQCSSALKSSAAEVPCDLCGSSAHLEQQCDYLWKYPSLDLSSNAVSVSLSCAHCASSKHLIGDCPSLSRPITTSSFTLAGIDPNSITNLNSHPVPRSGPVGRVPRGMGPRGRGGGGRPRSPSPDSDDDMFRSDRRPPPAGPRGRGRGNIRIGNVGFNNRNFGGGGPPPRGGGRGRGPPRGGGGGRGRRGK
ncbi:hypothetical protein N7474_006590 [Penicillium riverlandense]|uniref:uncharacterized protein n=1 Tax=Penicillium riverlandense TaxID=1903569 RepID=UPI0025483216|nr:uncharacterized protein N7474_006590 [Penicillium riverlandense]KAJ5814813.1 hypothetical protein N7474_006590 [Penicillium riverlandense]